MRNDPAIRVVGGSVAGLTVAVSLVLHGLSNVQVYEAMRNSAATQGGGTLGVTRATVTALNGLGIEPSEYLSSLRKAPPAEVSDWDRVGYTSWYEISHALRARLPDGVWRGGMRLRSHSPVGGNQSVLGFANGERAGSDLTIFADGRGSLGRRLVGDPRKLTYGECVTLRGQAMPPTPEFADRAIGRKFPDIPAHFGCLPLTRRKVAVPPGQETPLDWFLTVNLSTRKFQKIAGDHPTIKTFVPPAEITSDTRKFIFDKAGPLPDELKSIVHNSHLLQISPLLDIAPPTTMTFRSPGGAPAVLLGDALAPQRPQTGQGMNLAVSQSVWLAHLVARNQRGEISENELFQQMDEAHLPVVTHMQQRGIDICESMGLGTPPKVVIPFFKRKLTAGSTAPPARREGPKQIR